MKIHVASADEMAASVGYPGPLTTPEKIVEALATWRRDLQCTTRRVQQLELDLSNERHMVARAQREVAAREQWLKDNGLPTVPPQPTMRRAGDLQPGDVVMRQSRDGDMTWKAVLEVTKPLTVGYAGRGYGYGIALTGRYEGEEVPWYAQLDDMVGVQ